jgi:UDP-N-acetylglucosamine--N-acetylmuramyl-(pentapeptide) pyrophosphoryl-undecaprenol N-acetylglucosamine transferase
VTKHLVIMAAGTGGHIMPGLAVAREMQSRGFSVSWLGTRTGMENRIVPPTQIPLDTVAFSGLRGKGWLGLATGGFRLLGAFWACLSILRNRKPSAVLGMGGYVTFPGGLMASLLGKPLVLVNADAALLLSNKSLLPIADKVCFGLPSESAMRVKRAVVTGNPVRTEIANLPPPAERYKARSGALRVLVVGGSLGAKVLNDLVPAALALMPQDARPILVHQAGEKNAESVKASYLEHGLEGDVRPFINDMAFELASCDVVLCRAGAVTVSELCAAGVASLLVPLVVSTTSHQRDNALWLSGLGAAHHLPQTELTAERLAATFASLTRPALQEMAILARNHAVPGAAARVADEIERLVR